MTRSRGPDLAAPSTDGPDPKLAHFSSGHVLARSAVLNFLGQALPLLAALVAIPLLAAGLGIDRFGVLSLAWVLIGYVSLFDLGLGRALTQLVAQRLGRGEQAELPVLVRTALLLMAAIGLTGSIALACLTPLLVRRALEVPAAILGETLLAFYLIAAAVPFLTVAAGLRGILEAHQRFDLVNVVRMPMSSLSYLGPLVLLPFSQNVAAPVGFLLAERILTAFIYLSLCRRVMPSLWHHFGIAPKHWSGLLRFGGWMTVTNVVGPLMVYFDRFLIGGLLSVTAVAHYSTPYDFVTRMLVIPGALAGVLFPAFASVGQQTGARATTLFLKATQYIFILLWPLALIVAAFSFEILNFWMGAEFASAGAAVMRWLAVGVLLNGLAQVPFALVQGHGRPDLTAKLHLAEALVYFGWLWWSVTHFGIVGAAAVWTLRVALDTSVLFLFSRRMLQIPLSNLLPIGRIVGLGIVTIVIAGLVPSPLLRVIYCLLLLSGLAVVTARLLRAETAKDF